jgi:hypothetical protein
MDIGARNRERRRKWMMLRDELRQYAEPHAVAARQAKIKEERAIAEYNRAQEQKVWSYCNES